MKSKNIFSTADKAKTEKLISRRIALLTISQAGLFSLLGARLAYLQLFKHDEYSSLSDENRFLLPSSSDKPVSITPAF